MKCEKWVRAVGMPLVLAAITLQVSSAAGEIVHPRLFASARLEQNSYLLENHYFNLGNRDGFREYEGKKHSSRPDAFPNEKAKEAYEAGYNKGCQGKRSYRLDHPLSIWGIVRVPSEKTQ